jgi:hypothetical protein
MAHSRSAAGWLVGCCESRETGDTGKLQKWYEPREQQWPDVVSFFRAVNNMAKDEQS